LVYALSIVAVAVLATVVFRVVRRRVRPPEHIETEFEDS